MPKLSNIVFNHLHSLHNQTFNIQRSNHRQILADFARIVNKLVLDRPTFATSDSDNEKVAAFLCNFLINNRHTDLLSKVKDQLFGSIIANIKAATTQCSDRETPRFVSLISNNFTRKQLETLGFHVSKQSFAAGNRHGRNHGPGAPVQMYQPNDTRTLTSDELYELKQFLIEHSQPAANRCTVLGNQVVPTRYLDRAIAELHRLWLSTQHRTVGKTQFRKAIKRFRQFKRPHLRGTDMCKTCYRGRLAQKKVQKTLQGHKSTCAYAVFVQSLLSHAPSDFRTPQELQSVITTTSTFDVAALSACNCNNRTCASSDTIETLAFFFHHHALKSQQRAFYRQSLEQLPVNECIVTIDFKQNISINTGPVEVSQHYYQRSFRSILGCYVVFRDPSTLQIQHHYVNNISEMLTHDSVSAFEQLHQSLLESLPHIRHVTKVHIWTDSGNHFRSQELLCNILSVLPKIFLDNGIRAEVSQRIFVEGHGKNACDGHFSLLSRWLDQIKTQTHLLSTDQLIAQLKQQSESHALREGVTVKFLKYQPTCHNNNCQHYQSPVEANSDTNGPAPMDIDEDESRHAVYERLDGEGRGRCIRQSYLKHSFKLPTGTLPQFYHWKMASPPSKVQLPHPGVAAMFPNGTDFTNRVSVGCSVMPLSTESMEEETVFKDVPMSSTVDTSRELSFASRLTPISDSFSERTLKVRRERARIFRANRQLRGIKSAVNVSAASSVTIERSEGGRAGTRAW